MSVRLSVNDMQNMAALRGGKCLSKEYINSTSHLEWMCKTGHRWDSPYYVLQQGGWCPRCAKFELDQEKYTEAKETAKKNSIKVLSDSYKGHSVPLTFECKRGHHFEKTFKQFIDRPFCYDCYRLEEKENGYKKLLAIAKEKNGKVLSKEYFGSNKKHKFQCSEGHKWEGLPTNVERGQWCGACAKIINDEKQRKNRLPELQKHAAKLGGKVLSTEYFNRHSKIKWQCKEGHIWIAPLTSVIHHNAWCRKCSYKSQRLGIEEFQKLAKKRKGQLLSREYTNTKTKLEWQCEKDHKWKAFPSHIKKGTWCPTCAGKKTGELKRLTLSEVQNLAKAKGGKLLSKSYKNQNEKLDWQCGNGHVWQSSVAGIRVGWCARCHFDNKKLGIEIFQEIAKSKGGKLLSKEYSTITTKLEWQCAKGHKWKTAPAFVKKGTWCPTCGTQEAAKNRRRYTIAGLQEHAKNQGGKLLTEEYKSSIVPLKWQCKEGHTWMAPLYLVISRGSWCKICNDSSKKTPIEDYIKLAKAKKGLLLSKKYTNVHANLTWQCKEGHKWEATPKSIKKGLWCQTCKSENRKSLVLKEFQAIAVKRGGKLLSKAYIDSFTHLKWQCSKGHTWETVPADIKRGTWCRICVNMNRAKS